MNLMMKLVNLSNLNEVTYSSLCIIERDIEHIFCIEIFNLFHSSLRSSIDSKLFNTINREVYEELKNELTDEIT